jgi:hypothetical protein
MLDNSLLFSKYNKAKVPTNNIHGTQHPITAIQAKQSAMKTLTVEPPLVI